LCVNYLHKPLSVETASTIWMFMFKRHGMENFEKHMPLLLTVLYLATGDYRSLIHHLGFFF
ncbi:MAG TPA: hypothetical protein VK503_10660, partial [Candidatus Bathyarchaeia archaeon]|nr:hypothetical protein [Candidatus Bathyarchaeia archaeon]